MQEFVSNSEKERSVEVGEASYLFGDGIFDRYEVESPFLQAVLRADTIVHTFLEEQKVFSKDVLGIVFSLDAACV